MSRNWIRETPPRWDEAKQRIVGGAPEGSLALPEYELGAVIAGDWWRVDESGETVGYGWLDSTWGEAEILLAVDQKHQGLGIGGWILDQLEHEARAAGLNYMYNVVQATHPHAARVTAWLKQHGFKDRGDGRLERRVK